MPVWNRIDNAVRWAAQELRRLCPQPEFGTRSIARQLLRSGIQISRSTVRRVMNEPEKKEPEPKAAKKPAMGQPLGVESHGVLKPEAINESWHMDFILLHVLWFSFTVAAIMDGFSRRILAFKVYRKTPTRKNALGLFRRTAKAFGQPRVIITDCGCQFGLEFGKALPKGTEHVQSPVRHPWFNGKIERLFKSFRWWWRLILPSLTQHGLQRKLDRWVSWYNGVRSHSMLGGKTPDEAWAGQELPEPIPIRAADPTRYRITVQRKNFADDPRLPAFDITVRRAA
jgi:putative transposase